MFSRNSKRAWMVLTLLSALALLVTGCTVPVAAPAAAPAAAGEAAAPVVNENERYVMVSNVASHPYWLDAQYGGRDAAAQLGVVWEYTGPAEYDTPAQVTAIEQIIATKPAGLLIAALQPDALVPVINQAIEAGIPVVTVDTDAPTSMRMTYLGTDNYQAGRLMGRRIIEVLGGSGQVGLATVPGQFNLEERIRGIEDELVATDGAVEIVAVVDNKADDAATTDTVVAMLQANPDIDLVSSINATGAGVAAALRQTDNVGKVKAVTFDITEPIIQALEDGTIDSTLVQRTYLMTYLGVQLLHNYNHQTEYAANWSNNGLVPMPNGVDTGVMVITKDQLAPFKPAE